MANPMFCVGVLAEATYTATSTNSSFPLSNLSTYVPTDLWKSNANTSPQYLMIDYGSAVSRNYALFHQHNLNSMTTVSLQAADSADYLTNLVTVVADIKTATDPVLFTFGAVTKRYWRINYANTGANIPQMVRCSSIRFSHHPLRRIFLRACPMRILRQPRKRSRCLD